MNLSKVGRPQQIAQTFWEMVMKNWNTHSIDIRMEPLVKFPIVKFGEPHYRSGGIEGLAQDKFEYTFSKSRAINMDLREDLRLRVTCSSNLLFSSLFLQLSFLSDSFFLIVASLYSSASLTSNIFLSASILIYLDEVPEPMQFFFSFSYTNDNSFFFILSLYLHASVP